MENSIMWIANMFSRPPFKPFDTLETIKRASQFGLSDYSYILVTLWLIQGGGGCDVRRNCMLVTLKGQSVKEGNQTQANVFQVHV